jgi:hypothetical protein
VQRKLKSRSGDSDFACRLRGALEIFCTRQEAQAEKVLDSEDTDSDSTSSDGPAVLEGVQGPPSGCLASSRLFYGFLLL